jgi:hypothetical protein
MLLKEHQEEEEEEEEKKRLWLVLHRFNRNAILKKNIVKNNEEGQANVCQLIKITSQN